MAVFKVGEPAKYVQIVYKGLFEMERELKTADRRKTTMLNAPKGADIPKDDNMMTQRFPDQHDFPKTQKISTFQKGSVVIGDCIVNQMPHQVDFICMS